MAETSPRDQVYYAVLDALHEGESAMEITDAVREAMRVYREEALAEREQKRAERQKLPLDASAISTNV